MGGLASQHHMGPKDDYEKDSVNGRKGRGDDVGFSIRTTSESSSSSIDDHAICCAMLLLSLELKVGVRVLGVWVRVQLS